MHRSMKFIREYLVNVLIQYTWCYYQTTIGYAAMYIAWIYRPDTSEYITSDFNFRYDMRTKRISLITIGWTFCIFNICDGLHGKERSQIVLPNQYRLTNGNEVEIIKVILIQLVSFQIQNFISCNQECQVNVAAVLYVDIIIHCTSKLIEQMNM